jgi:ribosome biogenesis protein ENP2
VAPAWCSFLDNITEELEETSNNGKEGTTTVFDNYKFVSREELERLGITNLIGTPMLKAYMHGFFIDTKLYQRVQAVKEPDSYEQYRKAKIKENMAAKSRISEQRAPPAHKITTDARFGDLLTNPDFAVDEQTEDFRLRHPSGVSSKRQRAENFDSDEEKESSTGSVAAEEEEEIEDADLSDDSSDEDSVGFRKVHDDENDATEEPRRISGQKKQRAGAHKSKTSAPAKDEGVSSRPSSNARNRKLTLEETDDDVARMDRSDARRTLAERVSEIREEELANPVFRINESGKKEVTFIPKSKSNSSRDREDRDGSDTRERHERRGIKELGLRRQPMWEGTGRGAGRGRGRGAGRGRGRGRGSSR